MKRLYNMFRKEVYYATTGKKIDDLSSGRRLRIEKDDVDGDEDEEEQEQEDETVERGSFALCSSE